MIARLKAPFLFAFSLFTFISLYSEEAQKSLSTDSKEMAATAIEGYTINYNTVSIVEYIRFASKICNINFIFNEEDLNFTVTVVSDAPITPQNVMGTLIQVLRIHGLSLLEQDNNLVIHKSPDVIQIATLVTNRADEKNAPIVTRIFRVKEAKAETIAGIIRPMISASALLEVLSETRQLILTDVTVNVNKVAALIDILDAPVNQLAVKTYVAVHNTPENLIELASQIMTPLSQGSPFILVPQPMASAIYIVSTNDLIDQTISVLTSLDVPAKEEVLAQRKLKGENIFVYKAINRPSDEILRSLIVIAQNLQKSGTPEGDLISTMETGRSITETNSITFVGSKDSIAKVKEFLVAIDVPGKEMPAVKSSFFVYRPKNRSAKEIDASLKEMADHLKGAKETDAALVQVLSNAKINKMTNSILFSGDESQFGRVKDLLATIDTPSGTKQPEAAKHDFFIYKIQNASFDELQASLKSFAKNLDRSNVQDLGLIQTIDNMKPISETNSILFSGPDPALTRLKELVPAFDSGISALPVSNQFFIYKTKSIKPDQLAKSIQEVAHDLKSDQFRDPAFMRTLESMKVVKNTGSFMFTGDGASLKRLEDLIATIDQPTGKPTEKVLWLYSPKYVSREKAETYFKQLSNSLDKESEGELIDVIRSMKWIDASQSFLVQGTSNGISRFKEMLTNFDQELQVPQRNFLLYPLQNATLTSTNQYLDQLVENFNKKGGENLELVDTIRSRKWIPDSHSFMFQGTESSLARVKEILKDFDVTPATPQKNFFLYPLQYASLDNTNQYLDQLVESLKKGGGTPDFIEAIQSRKWIPNSHSFMFQGSDSSLARIKDILKDFDVPSAPTPQKNFFLYTLQYAPPDKTAQYLDQLAANLSKEGEEKDLVDVIRSKKWIENSHSFMFNGPPATLDRVKDLLANFDKPESRLIKPGYFIYKVQSTTGDLIEEELDALAKDLKQSGLKDDKVLNVIENMRYVKETNSLLLTGSPAAIDEVKALIAEYDYPRTSPNQINSNFFMYKPQHQTAAQIEKSLREVGTNLKSAGLADPFLLRTINSAKYVETTNSLIFTGNADSIQKVQVLLQDIDTPPKEHAPIQQIGKTTFLLYKLKVAGGQQIVTSIQTMTADLKKAGGADPDLIKALNTMKYVKETNSLFFTGTEPALQKVQGLIEQFDVTSLAPPTQRPEPTPSLPGQTNFYLYKPVSIPVQDLEKLMQDFAENVRSSGLSDPELFAAISSMRPVEKTQSLVFTGTPKALDQIKDLLRAFDIPANLKEKPMAPPMEPSIQAVDNTSFLVYKLQFHKGDEIQTALKQIAKDLINTNAPVNQNLLNSINSIQWLDVTNSLLCSGDQETLVRLKELIKNLDIPLKQVFIEILVIETTLSNALLFGLEWGGNYKFNEKFGISSFNTVPPPNQQSVFPDQFISKLSGLTPPGDTPTPVGNIPPVSGFDLGVIGEVVKHNGNTFLTLGSLLNALQSNNETTIITAPKILGQDGRTSTIFSGANIPFTGSFVNNTTSGATILTSNIEYRDIGLNLTITPVLGNSDIVTLDINLDRSQTATDISGQSQLNFQSQTANGIITSKTTMQTTVHVPDRNFLVLSGFVNNSNTKIKQGIPCLGGLPMIGAAFSQQNDTISNQNVVIFLRPFIINSIDDMRRVTSEQEIYFRDLSTTPFLEHNYDDAIELIKSIDDD